MFLNKRNKSNELNYLEVLSIRAELTDQERKTLERLRKGYAGEQLYDRILDEVGHEQVNIFRDIWIKADKSLTQIDSLIISDETVIINEIKNYSGQYKYDNNNWYIGKAQISDDPLIQSRRAASKLIKIFRENNMSIHVENKVIFPNPYFILDTNDEQCRASIVKRDRLKYYFRTFNQLPSWSRHEKIIELLKSYTVAEPAHPQQADDNRLTFGRYCPSCTSFNLQSHRSFTICRDCHHKSDNKAHVLAAVRDFQILFNEQNVTTTAIQKMLNHEISNTTVKRYLRQYCTPANNGRFRTYSLRHPHTS
ncbi:nuclease-related domain-containing protein [Salinicoccus halitifaciens]|uniref:NERD domain-containing protein n=1 Tax=Salinicoccus halitifaciens TaxID=1073415 RepID=A0ABV2EDJ0_9STAP|nr:nuclease-related domain-containing protein [Salinicoccus halitifaciens]MCD2138726.1 NERD domain-containing protein [Salinicoccus halitifaciens]